MKMYKVILVILFLISSMLVKAQDTTNLVKKHKLYLIETTAGGSTTAILISEDSVQVVLESKSFGTITLKREKIVSMKEIDESSFVNGVYWFDNPNSTRYLLGPSAFHLKKGEGYYQNIYLGVHSFNVGVTNGLSIGGGIETFSLLFGDAPQLAFLTPKYSFQVAEKLNLGVGTALFKIFKNAGAIGYGLVTMGTKNNNLTMGMGWGGMKTQVYNYSKGVINEEFKYFGRPIITLSGMVRTGKRFALTTENWIYPVSNNAPSEGDLYDVIFTYGVRFMGEKMSVDLGFINHRELSEFIKIGIPYVDFVVKFGGKKSK